MSESLKQIQEQFDKNKHDIAVMLDGKAGDELVSVIKSDEYQKRSKAQKLYRDAMDALQPAPAPVPPAAYNRNAFPELPDVPQGGARAKSMISQVAEEFAQTVKTNGVSLGLRSQKLFDLSDMAADPGYQQATRSKSLFAFHPDHVATIGAGTSSISGPAVNGSLGGWCNYLFDPNRVNLPNRLQNCVLDLVTVIPTDKSRIFWQEEFTLTDSARTVRENMTAPPAVITDIKPESSFGFQDQTIAVETIAHRYRVSRQTWEDCRDEVETQMDYRGRYGLERALVDNIINGNGTAPNMRGLAALPTAAIAVNGVPPGTNAMNVITYTPGASPNDQYALDALIRAQVAVQMGGCDGECTVIMNPVDVGKLRRLKTTQNEYVLQLGCGLDDILCCKICPTAAVPVGTAYLGQFTDNMYLWLRKGITMIMGLEGTDLSQNMLTVIYEMRAGLQIKRNYCISRVVGLP